MNEIRREMTAYSVDTVTVILVPITGLLTMPQQEEFTRVTIETTATLPTDFFKATGGCDRYEVIIRRKN